MMFEKEKYYKYIQNLEKRLDYYYVFCIGISALLGYYLFYIKGLIVGLILGLILANFITLEIKIKIQKMKIDIDMYEKLIK